MNVLGGILADLRERRLLPVAIALAVALVAVPLLLLKSEEAGSKTGAPAAATSGASGAGGPPLVALATLHASSNLDTFDSENPFDSPQPIPELTPTDELTSTPSSSKEATGGATGGSGGSGGSGGGSVGGFEFPPTIPDTTTPDSPTTNPRTGNGNDGNDNNDDDKTVTKTVYTHAVDLAFGAPRQLRAFRDIPRLSMLPSALDPMLVFLGVNTSATKAVFLVDARLKGEGEGKCRDAACAFLEIGVGNVHGFTDQQDGKRYVLRLDQIRKVEVNAASSRAPIPLPSEQDDQAADGDDPQGPAAAGSVVRRFMSPLFGDQIEVEVQQ